MANDYDFIMNPQTPQTGPTMTGPKKLLAIVGLFGGAIVLIVIILTLVLAPKNGGSKEQLTSVIAHQTEVNRVIELGIDDVSDLPLKQRIATLNAVVLSDLQEANGIAASRKYKIEPLQRNSQIDTSVDGEIEEAKARRELDKALEVAVSAAASNYLRALNDASNASNSKAEKELYSNAIASLQTIVATQN